MKEGTFSKRLSRTSLQLLFCNYELLYCYKIPPLYLQILVELLSNSFLPKSYFLKEYQQSRKQKKICIIK